MSGPPGEDHDAGAAGGEPGATPQPPEQPGLSDLPGVAAFAVMGSTIATCIGVGVVLGLGADRAWHTSPWGLIFGIVLGTVAAVVSVVKLVRRFL
ncbi:MAG: AtpZ/AtpI family protein [Acidobacteriota bacterium]|nr:AtpZ/AtpI family protein [Acidobacteriota bacterium]